MKAITNTRPGTLELVDWPMPQPGQGQVRIRTGACGICATDMHMIDGWARTGFPSIPGHEWAGTVDAIGPGSDGYLLGRRCVGENVLSSGGEVGFELPGGYGEYFLTEAANIYPLPDDFPLTIATLMEPLAVSVRGIKKLHLENKNKALIMGDGAIGLLVLMLLQRAGLKDIFLVGGRDHHLSLAREIGARQTFNYHRVEDKLSNAVIKEAGNDFPIVVEASGSADAIQASMQLVHGRGQILVLGDYRITAQHLH
jgi:threonine dehydrogenase-like Zn-dependent dehydrogenase